jgi:uncharacterized protein YggT (Ycf19 family)
MSLIDLLLNLAGLLVWLGWRARGANRVQSASPISLLSTLKRTSPAPASRHFLLLGLLVLLGGRSLLYWHFGSSVNWMPQLELGVVGLTFRSDFLSRMILFSLFSFSQIFLTFYLCLFLLSAVNRSETENDPIHRMVRFHLGWFERWPVALKWLAPFLIGAVCWALLNPLLTALGIIPAPLSMIHVAQQAVVVGLGAYLAWKLLIVVILFFNLVNAFVFLGNFAILHYLNLTARHLLRPLEWLPLRSNLINFSPVIGMTLVIFISELLSRGLTRVFQRLPLT